MPWDWDDWDIVDLKILGTPADMVLKFNGLDKYGSVPTYPDTLALKCFMGSSKEKRKMKKALAGSDYACQNEPGKMLIYFSDKKELIEKFPPYLFNLQDSKFYEIAHLTQQNVVLRRTIAKLKKSLDETNNFNKIMEQKVDPQSFN